MSKSLIPKSKPKSSITEDIEKDIEIVKKSSSDDEHVIGKPLKKKSSKEKVAEEVVNSEENDNDGDILPKPKKKSTKTKTSSKTAETEVVDSEGNEDEDILPKLKKKSTKTKTKTSSKTAEEEVVDSEGNEDEDILPKPKKKSTKTKTSSKTAEAEVVDIPKPKESKKNPSKQVTASKVEDEDEDEDEVEVEVEDEDEDEDEVEDEVEDADDEVEDDEIVSEVPSEKVKKSDTELINDLSEFLLYIPKMSKLLLQALSLVSKEQKIQLKSASKDAEKSGKIQKSIDSINFVVSTIILHSKNSTDHVKIVKTVSKSIKGPKAKKTSSIPKKVTLKPCKTDEFNQFVEDNLSIVGKKGAIFSEVPLKNDDGRYLVSSTQVLRLLNAYIQDNNLSGQYPDNLSKIKINDRLSEIFEEYIAKNPDKDIVYTSIMKIIPYLC